MDEMCFSTYGSNPDDLREIKKTEEDKEYETAIPAKINSKKFSVLNAF